MRKALHGGALTDATRAAVSTRLATPQVIEPRFFTSESLVTLRAVCARLVPQPHPGAVDIAGAIDTRLADGIGDGWRYDAMPSDGEAYERGLVGLDETAREMSGGAFIALSGERQDAVISAVEGGSPAGATWRSLPARRFFEDLLAEAIEAYYSHPLGQEEIGYLGLADAPGWQLIQLGERHPRETPPVIGEQPHHDG